MTLVTASFPLFFLSILCLISCDAETTERIQEDKGPPIEGRIVRGENAKPGQFPFQAQFRYQFNATDYKGCGAVIIDKNSVLTAAHCVFGRDQELMTVWAGRIITDGGDPHEQGRSVLSYVYHEYFTYRGVKGDLNDLAIITVNQSFEFNDFVKPVKIPLSTEPIPARGLVSGWGMTRPNETAPPFQLKYIEINTISNADCQRLLDVVDIQDQHLCIYSNDKPKRSICMGDSGGGFVDKNGQLFGIVSFYSDDCSGGKPQVLARIIDGAFLYWIDHHNRTCSYQGVP